VIGINIDLSDFSDLLNLTDNMKSATAGVSRNMAAMIRGKAIELANQKLHSRRKLYVDALSIKEGEDDVWIVNLAKEAAWIEDGMCVVYGKSDAHMPSILTPDGWVKLEDVKVGMLVLNRHNKWTPIIKIHDNSLFDYCEEIIDEEATAMLQKDVVKRKFDHHTGSGRRSKKKNLVVRCPNCNTQRITSLFSFTDCVDKSCCVKCISKRKLVSFKINRQGFEKKLTLTAEHIVFTQRGELAAGELKSTDILLAPAWGSCEWCNNKVAFGGNLCSVSCAASLRIETEFNSGTHISQDPLWKTKFYKRMGERKVSNVEDVVAKLLVAAGSSVCYFGEDNADWIRQYRVPSTLDSKGRQKYYFIDFYNPKLGLALEVDGFFHFTSQGLEKDKMRDRRLMELGITPVHVPVSTIKSGVFEHQTLPSLLANHSGDIELIPVKILDLKHFTPTRFYPMRHRWDITVAEGESYVCQGFLIHNSAHSMLEGLLASPKAKTSKSGDKYIIVPFDHSPGQGPASTTPQQQDLITEIKAEMKRRNIPFGKKEIDANGNAKMGRLHSFDITKAPLKTVDGPGMGHGPIGDVRQGNTGIPFLQGVSVYQGMDQKGKVKRSILTFRVASSKHKDQSLWEHPGVAPEKILDSATEWAMNEFDKEIVPLIMEKIINS
jgi:hypothetical protein